MADDETIDLGISGLTDAVLVGRGGFASVYRARQPDFRRTVAVKVLSAPETDSVVARARFDRECQAMGALSEHPHIVTLYDAGFLADGRAYLVMAFMEGGSLHEVAHGADKPSWQEVATIGTKLAGALETAHGAGILHRDLKPANVLVSGYGEPQLTDFGIARIAGGHETTSSHVTASLPYAPPEILDGLPPSQASDVYSLAATLVHLLIGGPPFTGDADTGFAPLLRRVYEEEIPDLSTHGAPPTLDVVLRRAMAKDPARRQRSAEELGRQIQQAQRTLGAPVGEMVVAGLPRDAIVDADAPTIPGATPPGDAPAGPPAGEGPQWWTPPAGVPIAGGGAAGGPPPGSGIPPPAASPPPAAPPPSTPAAPFATSPPPLESSRATNSINRWLFGAIAAAVVALLGIVGVVTFTGGDDAGQVATATPEATSRPAPSPTDEPAPTEEPATTPTPVATPTAEPEVPTPAPPTPTPGVVTAPVGGPIVLGDSVTATLSQGQGARHTFQAEAGEVVRFEVTSPDGDPRIVLRSPNDIPISGADDCSALLSDTDALLVTELAVAGEYSLDIDFINGSGSYTLTTVPDWVPAQGEIGFMQISVRPATNFQSAWAIADGDLSLIARSGDGRVIAADDDCFGDLDPRLESFLADPDGLISVGAYTAVPPVTLIGLFDVEGFAVTATMPEATRSTFAVDLVAGQQVELLMRSADADAFLAVSDADETVLASDDDSGGNLDAQLTFTAPADGRYQIATSFLGDAAGSFSLGVLIR